MKTDCETCDGAGVVTIDRADRRGEHETVEAACPDCADRSDERAEYLDEIDELYIDRGGEGGEVSWEGPL